MNVYRITITVDECGDPELIFYTSEELSDIQHVLERELAIYESRQEHDKANGDIPTGDEDESGLEREPEDEDLEDDGIPF